MKTENCDVVVVGFGNAAQAAAVAAQILMKSRRSMRYIPKQSLYCSVLGTYCQITVVCRLSRCQVRRPGHFPAEDAPGKPRKNSL